MYLPIYVKLSLLSFSYSFHTPDGSFGPPAEDRYFAGTGRAKRKPAEAGRTGDGGRWWFRAATAQCGRGNVSKIKSVCSDTCIYDSYQFIFPLCSSSSRKAYT